MMGHTVLGHVISRDVIAIRGSVAATLGKDRKVAVFSARLQHDELNMQSATLLRTHEASRWLCSVISLHGRIISPHPLLRSNH